MLYFTAVVLLLIDAAILYGLQAVLAPWLWWALLLPGSALLMALSCLVFLGVGIYTEKIL